MTHEEYTKAYERSKEEAQRKIFDEYFKYVYTIVFSRLRSCARREDIEECVGDVFADVYIHYDSSKAVNKDISGFIGTIARNKAADMYRKLTRKGFSFVSVDDEDVPEQESPENTEADFEKKELRSSLMNCISLLGEPDSTIIMQKYFFMRSSKEIAEKVSLTPEAVRMRCSRALKRLREKLTAMNISL
ncbi:MULTISPECIES: RNA polymerase sigma factor [Ruminococcus]|uniref:RNA polymerase sigma-70 factor, ECF subfamily n=1 Tax=Ruminococcus flavefaciens TaxID=1265 RepID=A0A1M7MSR1_RUMFL|nr:MULTISPECIES: sigma-70 family RNA polymerase sigma factor [Ruminococcus]MCR4794156.1 sigma-70 family RNA polymerase sigma factor [Ruminococcus sp.]SHM94138.1 RNA polymerase sigma-70 factor, ECF subfamily [Ruminococcus flavefaciens]